MIGKQWYRFIACEKACPLETNERIVYSALVTRLGLGGKAATASWIAARTRLSWPTIAATLKALAARRLVEQVEPAEGSRGTWMPQAPPPGWFKTTAKLKGQWFRRFVFSDVYVPIPKACPLTARQNLVWWVRENRIAAKQKNPRIYLTVAGLARMTGLHRETIRKAIARFEALGLKPGQPTPAEWWRAEGSGKASPAVELPPEVSLAGVYPTDAQVEEVVGNRLHRWASDPGILAGAKALWYQSRKLGVSDKELDDNVWKALEGLSHSAATINDTLIRLQTQLRVCVERTAANRQRTDNPYRGPGAGLRLLDVRSIANKAQEIRWAYMSSGPAEPSPATVPVPVSNAEVDQAAANVPGRNIDPMDAGYALPTTHLSEDEFMERLRAMNLTVG